jgi:hypothetical protein
MHRAHRPRLRSLTPAALAGAVLVAALAPRPGAGAPAATGGATLSAAPTPPPAPTPTPAPAPTGPAPRAAADSKRMFAVTYSNMVVYENGAGYLHAFWRTLGSQGPDTPARLQWGRGCPDVSERTFAAIHTAFANPGGFFLIVDKAPDARQPGAYCVTAVELERIHPPQPPPGAR